MVLRTWVPSRLWRYELVDQFDINSGLKLAYDPNTLWLLAIASWNDQTDVKVYNITAGELISHTILNSMEKHYVLLRNGTIFKVESDNPVYVLLRPSARRLPILIVEMNRRKVYFSPYP